MKMFNVVVMCNSTLWSGQQEERVGRVQDGRDDGVQARDDILMGIVKIFFWNLPGNGWSAWYRGWVMMSGGWERTERLCYEGCWIRFKV